MKIRRQLALILAISIFLSSTSVSFAVESSAQNSTPVISSTDQTVTTSSSTTSGTQPDVTVPNPVTEPSSEPVTTDPSAETPAVTPTDPQPANIDPPQDPALPETLPPAEIPQLLTTSTADPDTDTSDNVKTFKTNLTADTEASTGAATVSYPLTLPPGRNGMAPDLTLSYSSQSLDDGSAFGYGWSINIPYIERFNKLGLNSMYLINDFTSSVSGELEGVSMGTDGHHGVYGAKNDNGDFLKYTYTTDNSWEVTDKKGTVYKYGLDDQARLSSSNDSGKIFRWYLQEVRDTNNNFIKYSYTKISYMQVYPSVIEYTGNGSTKGPYSIKFNLVDRSDPATTFKTGFEVKTDKLINSIESLYNGSALRIYSLSYSTGQNGKRSLLKSITESGFNTATGATITLNADSFEYTNNNSSENMGFELNSNYHLPMNFFNKKDSNNDDEADGGARILDVNGDGLADIVYAENDTYQDTSNFANSVYINKGNNQGWELSTTMTVPIYFVWDYARDSGIKIADINGDKLPDILYAPVSSSKNKVFINTGDGWLSDSTWTIPVQFRTYNSGIHAGDGNGVEIGDVNGDGLADLIYSTNYYTPLVYLNLGNGSWDRHKYQIPPKLDYPYDLNYQAVVTDINGDGLDDIVSAASQPADFYVNNGMNIYSDDDPIWSIRSHFFEESFGSTLPIDLNGDGLLDLFWDGYPGGYINTGDGEWVSAGRTFSNLLPSGFFASHTDFGGWYTADVNGDGMEDLIESEQGENAVYINKAQQADILKKVRTHRGGSIEFEYKAAAEYYNNGLLNPKLPFFVNTVSKITTSDNRGNLSTETYEYEGGSYFYNNYKDRQFAGFNKVTATDVEGNKNIQYFHQGNETDTRHGEYSDDSSKIGKLYYSTLIGSNGKRWSEEFYKWETESIPGDRKFVKLTRKTTEDYGSDDSVGAKMETYGYDYTNGNLIEKVEYGQILASNSGDMIQDLGNDKYTTRITYAYGLVTGLPSEEIITDSTGNNVKGTSYYYDNLTFGNVSKGNMTRQSVLKSGTLYISTLKTYNSYGLVTDSTDQIGSKTTYTYDQYNLYPITATNALGQTESYLYSYASGKIIRKTDINGNIFRTNYDPLDRITDENQPDSTNPSLIVTKTKYVYYDNSFPSYFIKYENLDDAKSKVTYTYIDGLGRKIQERKKIEDPNTYSVRDFVYNNRGLLAKESLPYISTGFSMTSPTTSMYLYTSYSYDPLGQITTATNNLGSKTTDYYAWEEKVTDEENNSRYFFKDARGNLTSTTEPTGGSIFTTYVRNYLGKITKITDAKGNVRNFTYDSLGRLLTAEDLHNSSDTTFGTYSYVYDNGDNIVSKVDPKNQTVKYTYDALSRVLTEDYLGQAGTEVTYTYDNCTYGKGKECSITSNGVTTSYTYTPVGTVGTENIQIDGTNYLTKYAYDRQNNLIGITYPDNTQVNYGYSNSGYLKTLTQNNSSVITNIVYAPTGATAKVEYANGTTTENTFDPQKLYRLTSKVTKKGTSNIQNIAYVYDKVGNVTQITDTSAATTSKVANYTYDKLYRLTSAAITNTGNNNSYTQTYQYDEIGNIINKSDKGTYNYNGNQGSSYATPHAVTSIGTTNYVYDNNGNLISDGQRTFTWDYKNRLTKVVNTGGTTSYFYGEDSDRIKQINPSATLIYANKYYELENGKPTKNIFAGDENVASITQYESPQPAQNYNLSFDGTDDMVMTPIKTIQSSTSAGYTFEAWVYPTSVSAGRHQLISSDDGGFDWSILREGNKWYVFTGTSSYNTGFVVDLYKWQHIAATFKPGVGVKFYKNGVEKAISEISYDTSVKPIVIGDNPSYPEYFAGKIDEVNIWSIVRTKDEINSSMNAKLTGQIPPPYKTPIVGLLGFYQFDEGQGQVINNSIGSSHGILGATSNQESSDPVYGQETFPYTIIPNWLLSFDGTDDIVTTPLLLNQTATSPGYTYEAWVYPTSTSTGRHQVISSDNGGFDWSVLRDGGTWYVFNGNNSYTTGKTVDLNKWQHIAVSFKPGGSAIFYKNEEAGVTIAGGIGYDSSISKVAIGSNPSYPEYFAGKIDDVRIWNTIRTADQVKGSMKGILLGNETGLLSYWKIDEGQGQVLGDVKTGGTNNALLGTNNAIEAKDPAWLKEEIPY